MLLCGSSFSFESVSILQEETYQCVDKHAYIKSCSIFRGCFPYLGEFEEEFEETFKTITLAVKNSLVIIFNIVKIFNSRKPILSSFIYIF